MPSSWIDVRFCQYPNTTCMIFCCDSWQALCTTALKKPWLHKLCIIVLSLYWILCIGSAVIRDVDVLWICEYFSFFINFKASGALFSSPLFFKECTYYIIKSIPNHWTSFLEKNCQQKLKWYYTVIWWQLQSLLHNIVAGFITNL